MAETVMVFSSADPERQQTGLRRAKELGIRSIPVKSVDSFQSSLQTLQRDGVKIDRMIIDTHGSPGALILGDDVLVVSTLHYFATLGDLFTDGARVFIQGCNVAQGSTGRTFLRRFAETFLRRGGGRVGGATSMGLSLNWLGTKVYHFTGDIIYALVNRGATKSRVGVGPLLESPVGVWRVSIPLDGKITDYLYTFNASGQVTWTNDLLLHRESGSGSWSILGETLRISWNSGSREEWDCPLFSEEQPGRWFRPGGGISGLQAKIVSSSF